MVANAVECVINNSCGSSCRSGFVRVGHIEMAKIVITPLVQEQRCDTWSVFIQLNFFRKKHKTAAASTAIAVLPLATGRACKLKVSYLLKANHSSRQSVIGAA